MPTQPGGGVLVLIREDFGHDSLRDAGLEADLMIAHLASVKRRQGITISELAVAYRAAASALAYAATMASAAENAERFK